MPRRNRLIKYWNNEAAHYEQKTSSMERRYLADSRRWVCQRANGQTLEVAVGTGLNLPYYPSDLAVTAVDWSPQMLKIAEQRATTLGRAATFKQADAMALPFADGQFDSVVCTFSLCCIPNERQALSEMIRVLRPGGDLLLADHIVSSNVALRVVQHIIELFSIPLQGEHYTRRPLKTIQKMGLEIITTERLTHGFIERVHARKPI